MGKVYDQIDGRLREFIEAQHMFFVATAPSSGTGHVNLSPKGLDTFRILDPKTVAYLDFVGSGAETIAHLRENGRIVIMLCAFEGAPKIVRLHGEGDVLEPKDAQFAKLIGKFPPSSAIRSIIRVRLRRVSTSCGYGVPFYEYQSQRSRLGEWAAGKGEKGLLEYQREKNSYSIDGLAALRFPCGLD